MSVNAKMTAIADKIRSLLGITGTMGLDDMASHLETEQANIAGAFTAVQSKGGTLPDVLTSSNLAAAIASVPTSTMRTVTGTFTTGENGNFFVDCGVAPVIFYIYNEAAPTDYMAFIAGQTGSRAVMFGDAYGGLLEAWLEISGTGFGGQLSLYSWSFEQSVGANVTLNYISYIVEQGGEQDE